MDSLHDKKRANLRDKFNEKRKNINNINKFYYNKATPHVVDHPRVSISGTKFVIPVLKLIEKSGYVVLI